MPTTDCPAGDRLALTTLPSLFWKSPGIDGSTWSCGPLRPNRFEQPLVVTPNQLLAAFVDIVPTPSAREDRGDARFRRTQPPLNALPRLQLHRIERSALQELVETVDPRQVQCQIRGLSKPRTTSKALPPVPTSTAASPWRTTRTEPSTADQAGTAEESDDEVVYQPEYRAGPQGLNRSSTCRRVWSPGVLH